MDLFTAELRIQCYETKNLEGKALEDETPKNMLDGTNNTQNFAIITCYAARNKTNCAEVGVRGRGSSSGEHECANLIAISTLEYFSCA